MTVGNPIVVDSLFMRRNSLQQTFLEYRAQCRGIHVSKIAFLLIIKKLGWQARQGGSYSNKSNPLLGFTTTGGRLHIQSL